MEPTDWPPCLSPLAALPWAVATDVNRAGFVVGTSSDNVQSVPTLWENLGPYELLRAQHISRTGWIAGEARNHSAGDTLIGFVLEPLQ